MKFSYKELLYIYISLHFKKNLKHFPSFFLLYNIINIKTAYSGDHSSIANFRTKFPTAFRGIFEIYVGISKLLSVSSTNSRDTSKHVLMKPA